MANCLILPQTLGPSCSQVYTDQKQLSEFQPGSPPPRPTWRCCDLFAINTRHISQNSRHNAVCPRETDSFRRASSCITRRETPCQIIPLAQKKKKPRKPKMGVARELFLKDNRMERDLIFFRLPCLKVFLLHRPQPPIPRPHGRVFF